MALTDFEDAIVFWLSRAVLAHERLAAVAEGTLKIDQECAEMDEEPEAGVSTETVPIYTPEMNDIGEVKHKIDLSSYTNVLEFPTRIIIGPS
jgi:hypothetical protein